MSRVDVFTIFPDAFAWFRGQVHVRRALDLGLYLRFWDYRAYTPLKAGQVDDAPYGGGAGMVMLPGPVFEMLDTIPEGTHKVLLSPKGQPFCQKAARHLVSKSPLLLFCGRYEGMDQRARESFDEEISIGDFILNGGETAAMAIVEAVSRLVPGVLGNFDSTVEESFSSGMLEYPQYTRPEVIRNKAVPKVLLSGDHGKVAQWRKAQALYRTSLFRPDLFARLTLSETDKQLIADARLEGIFDEGEPRDP